MTASEWAAIKPRDFTPGLKVCKNLPTKDGERERTVTVGAFTGECLHGFHFGSDCFDKISTWWIPVNVTSKKDVKNAAHRQNLA